MRCTKCGAESPDETRFCPVCGHKLQSGRQGGDGDDEAGEAGTGKKEGPRLLDFQGWTKPGRGLGPYVEASLLAVVLAGTVVACQYAEALWPLYPAVAVCALVLLLRRL
ncbi:zinc ribbon domain-containing protein [Solidesulfovibrio sp.]|uniref:zinc ribbon domain-containing protein n=1 Tax=Solidesulfovibrio sp. TaxID=2910990 RepID=UPI00262E5E60|nr:zinc ribbon domain-containing protein [Solidesulfovibrio sp.]